MGESLSDFNQKRSAAYQKDAGEEDFLLSMNRVLFEREQRLYQDYPITHPFIFIFGLPRSGTTLISQLLAHSLDVGYINNLMARFWLAPLHGIRLSKSTLKNRRTTNFQSDYAATSDLADIHEFGYFWRFWLKKETMEDITRVNEREEQIDWPGLHRTLANMQHEFDRPMVFKNIFGSYHLRRLRQLLGKVIYVYIERDELDVAVSILEARRKYYPDLNTWWSYTPVEYDLLKDLDYRRQIAGQVYYLKRFYQRQIEHAGAEVTVRVDYREMCKQPQRVLEEVRDCSRRLYQQDIPIVGQPPQSFPFRSYQDRDEEKAIFAGLIEQLREKNG